MKRILLLVFLAGFAALSAAEEYSPWADWRQGTILFDRGEAARAKGEYIQALSSFQEAARTYRAVQKARPDWNQSVINARIARCEEEIAVVKRLLGADRAVTTAPRPAATEAPAAVQLPSTGMRPDYTSAVSSSELAALKTELEKYKQKNFGLIEENSLLRRQATHAETTAKDLENLMRERRSLQEKHQLLETRYAELERKLAAPNQELEQVRAQTVELKINHDNLAHKLQLADQNIARQEQSMAALQTQKADLERELAKHRADARQQETEFAALRRFREEALVEKNKALQLDRERQETIERLTAQLAARQQQLDLAARRLEEAARSTTSAGALNSEITTENRTLKQQLEKLTAERDESAQENRTLQNTLRELRSQSEEIRNALQRIDEQRKQALAEAKMSNERLTRQLAAEEIAAGELRNLRARNRQLEADLKIWLEKLEKTEKLLADRNNAGLSAIAGLNAENSALKDRLALAQADAEHLNSRLTRLAGQLDAAAKAERIAQTEISSQKAELETLREKQKTMTADIERLTRNDQGYQLLQQNFAAAQLELKEARKFQPQLQTLQTENTRLQAESKAFAELRSRFAELEKSNQSLADANAEQKGKLQAFAQADAEQKGKLQAFAQADAEQKNKLRTLAATDAEQKAQLQRLAQSDAEQKNKLQAQIDANAELRKQLLATQTGAGQKNQLQTLIDANAELGKQLLAAKTDLRNAAGTNAELKKQLQTADSDRQNQLKALADANAELKKQLQSRPAATAERPPVAVKPGSPAPVRLPDIPERKVQVTDTGRAPVEELLKDAAKAEKEEAWNVAVWNYRTVLETSPDSFEANFGLGRMLLRSDKFEESAAFLQTAHLRRPADLPCVIAYADALTGQKKYGNALSLLEKFTAEAARNYDLAFALGRAQAGAGQIPAAEKSLKTARQLRPDSSPVQLELARLLLDTRRDEAAQHYEKAKRLGAAPDPVLEPVLGKMLNERRELIEFLESAAKEAEKHKDAVSAAWYYGQLRELSPDNPAYEAALKKANLP